jgi:hypothetical protein
VGPTLDYIYSVTATLNVDAAVAPYRWLLSHCGAGKARSLGHANVPYGRAMLYPIIHYLWTKEIAIERRQIHL